MSFLFIEMGVKNLFNTLYNEYSFPIVHNIDNLIIDGNNLIYVVGCRHIASLRKEYPVELPSKYSVDTENYSSMEMKRIFLKMIALPPTEQIKKLLDRITFDVIELIEILKDKYNLKNVILMTDPINTKFKITRESILNSVGENHVEAIIDGDHEIVELNIKELEQELRKKTHSSTDTLEFLKKIVTEEEFILLSQFLYFMDNSMLIKLSQIIFSRISKEINVSLYIGESEADLSIRKLCKELEEKKESMIVLSTDTDYHILLSDIDNAYVKNTFIFNKLIYYPKERWMNILDDKYSYEIISRIAPLLGNDYTIHSYIINNINTIDTIRKLFSIEGKPSDLLGGRAKNIKQIINNMKQDESVNTTILDNAIKSYNEIYYIRYIRSVVVYSDYKLYGKYNPLIIGNTKLLLFKVFTNLNNYLKLWCNENCISVCSIQNNIYDILENYICEKVTNERELYFMHKVPLISEEDIYYISYI